MKKIIKIFILQLLVFSIPVYAAEYTYTDDNANIEFYVDYSIWTETDLVAEREHILNKWENSCGVLLYSTEDVYETLSSLEKKGLERKEYNDSLIDYSFASEYVNGFKTSIEIDDWLIQNWSLKFIDMYGIANYDGVKLNYDFFSTLNNGYLIMFQYYGNGSDECVSKVEKVVKSTIPTHVETNYENDLSISNETNNNSNDFLIQLVTSLLLTVFCYMFFPVLCLIINKGRFDYEKAKKIALYNSIIVGVIFMIFTIKNGGNWNPAPAILYYCINKFILTNENSSKKKIQKEEKCLKDNEKNKCKKCGKQYLNTKLLIYLFSILVVIGITLILLFASKDASNNNIYRARHILVLSETEANVIIYKLNHGYDFCKLAEEYSQDDLNSSECGDLGYFSEGDMVIEFENAVKDLDYNEYTSKPIKTEYGYHIIMRIR